jgi:plasmid maintenance system killer protein
MEWKVVESRLLMGQVERAPKDIQQRYAIWRSRVQHSGPYLGGGYRVHALAGKRKGQMAARLNRQWRVIFAVLKGELIVEALELTPHKY